MKAIIFYGLLVTGMTNVIAQSEAIVQTHSITIEDFISYIIDDQAYDTPQIIYLAIEVGSTGFKTDEIFHIKQGLKLLSKRLPESSLVALGTYGYNGELIAHFTKSSELQNIPQALLSTNNLIKKEIADGIDLAFQTMYNIPDTTLKKSVLILRNNKTIDETSIDADRESESKISSQNVKKLNTASNQKLGGAIALTALSILPEVLDIIKD